jgi:hypothetical protein
MNKGGIKLNIELEKQKLDQVDASNIRTSLSGAVNCKLFLSIENKPRTLKSSSVFRQRSLRTNSTFQNYYRFPVPAGSVGRVRERHILSGNFTGQHQNKSFDVTEIDLSLGFADGIFSACETSA